MKNYNKFPKHYFEKMIFAPKPVFLSVNRQKKASIIKIAEMLIFFLKYAK